MMIKQALFATTVAMSVGSISFAWADTRPNPYTAIVDRNPFGIKDPPPPPPPPPEVTILPVAKVTLTGMTTIFGREPRVLLEISEQEQGKPPVIKKPILKEGEREGSVEIISIDMVKSVVRIKNGTVETNLVFEVAKAGGPAPASGAPVATALRPPSASGSPTIISPGGADSAGRPGSGVSLLGSTTANPVQTAAYQPASANSYTPGSQAASLGASSSLGATGLGANSFGVSTYGANDGSRANIPARPSRLGMDGQSPAMTREELQAHGYVPPPTPGGAPLGSAGARLQPPLLQGQH